MIKSSYSGKAKAWPCIFFCILKFVPTAVGIPIVIGTLCTILLFPAEQNPIANLPYAALPPVAGSKAISMGESFTAIADNLDTVYWNPAGVHFIARKMGMMLNITRQSEERWEDVVRTDPLRGGHFIYYSIADQGMAVSYRPVAAFSETINYKDVPHSVEVKISQYTMSFANVMGKQNNMVVGMNLNYYSGFMGLSGTRNNAPYANVSDGIGYGVDWGLLYFPHPSIRIGVSYFNAPASIIWDDYENESLPQIFRTGFSLQMHRLLLFTMELEKKAGHGTDEREIYHLGFNQHLGNYFNLRGGMFANDLNNQKNLNITGGLGYTKDDITFDLSVRKYYLPKPDPLPIVDYTVTMSIPFSGK